MVLQLSELEDRLKGLKLSFTYDPKVLAHIVAETYNPENGARPVRRYIQDMIEDAIADALVEKKSRKSVHMSVEKKKLTFDWK